MNQDVEAWRKVYIDAYRLGYAVGVADACTGIVESLSGFPDNPLWRKGYEHGRVDYQRRVDSLLLGDVV